MAQCVLLFVLNNGDKLAPELNRHPGIIIDLKVKSNHAVGLNLLFLVLLWFALQINEFYLLLMAATFPPLGRYNRSFLLLLLTLIKGHLIQQITMQS